jgi:hypothetical protein
VSRDGLAPAADATLLLAQFDPIFAPGDRRNEVWLELSGHEWEEY